MFSPIVTQIYFTYYIVMHNILWPVGRNFFNSLFTVPVNNNNTMYSTVAIDMSITNFQ